MHARATLYPNMEFGRRRAGQRPPQLCELGASQVAPSVTVQSASVYPTKQTYTGADDQTVMHEKEPQTPPTHRMPNHQLQAFSERDMCMLHRFRVVPDHCGHGMPSK
jgi:hypothetical protein